MTREQAINYLISSGFTHEQVGEVVRALTYEPITKNDLGVDCISRADALDCVNWGYSFSDIYKKINELPSVTPQLSVPEVTALAEWIEKLTKECEEAYNKGYEAGRKELEPITSKDKFIYALTACGCLLKDGKTWYEHDELIKCFEDLGLFEQEIKDCSDCKIVQACVEAGIRSTSRALDILDKIRAEIEAEPYVSKIEVLDIIDKYKAESEKT